MKTHLKNIYRKLEVSSRGEAVEKGKKLFKV
jgi:ATP/maltotriose-dependent transcriptional regulator MalT